MSLLAPVLLLASSGCSMVHHSLAPGDRGDFAATRICLGVPAESAEYILSGSPNEGMLLLAVAAAAWRIVETPAAFYHDLGDLEREQ